MRKSLHAYLQPSAAKRHEPIQEHLAAQLVSNIATTPAAFLDEITSYAVSFTLRLAYGFSGHYDIGHPFVQAVERNRKCVCARRPL